MSLSPQNEATLQKHLQKFISNFLINNLPDKVDKFVRPFLPEIIKNKFYMVTDLKNNDLYCNLKVFIGNFDFFRQAEIIKDSNLRSCAFIILNWRNKIAHRSPKTVFFDSYEQTLFEVIAINRFISLIPLDNFKKDEFDEIRNSTINIFHELTKSYLKSEQDNMSLNNENKLEVENKNVSNFEVYKEESSDDLIEKNSKFTKFEILQLLRKLRIEISEECPEIPKYRNILRESIIELFVDNKLDSLEKFEESMPKSQFLKTDPVQFKYFSKIKSIISQEW